MLNNSSTSATQTVKFNDIFVEAGSTVDKQTTGRIFCENNFANGWDSIYINPSSLAMGDVCKGMRCVTQPTILITTTNARMAFVVASEKDPVYILPENQQAPDGGYLLACHINPEIMPEYIYYMCQYNIWEKIINNTAEVIVEGDDWIEGSFRWNRIGTNVLAKGSFGRTGMFEELRPLTIQMVKKAIKAFSLPSLSHQKTLVDAAIAHEEKIADASKPKYNVAELIRHYLFRYLLQPSQFRSHALGLLRELYRKAAGNNVNKKVLEILDQYEYCTDIFNNEEIVFLANHINEVFTETISSNDVTFHPSEGFIQPQEVTDFLCKMASFPTDVTVYNPFAGANSYAITLPNRIIGEEVNPTTWALGQIRIFANNADKRTDIALSNSFESMALNKKYQAIITSPAYLHKKDQKISDIVRILYNKLEDGGTLACIVSAEFLFTEEDESRKVRELLVKEKAVKAVVMLPSNIFIGTSVAQAVIIVTKGIENDEILFGDATGHTRFAQSIYRATTFDLESFMEAFEEDIEDSWQIGYEPWDNQAGAAVPYSQLMGSDLIPSLYLTPKPENGVPLSTLVSEVPELQGKDISAEYFITGSSIPAALHRKPYVPTKVKDNKVSTVKKHVLMPDNAVILGIVNGNIRTVYTEGFTGKIAFPSGLIKILKPIDGISAKYLAALMATKIVADQIKAQTSGTTIPRLNKVNLSQIIVPLHESPEDREHLISEVLTSEMSDLEGELQETLDIQKREIRSTRHAMIQTLSALSSNWEQLSLFTKMKDGQINVNETIGKINPIAVKDLMCSIGYAISTLQRQVESLRFERSDWGQEVDINPYKFINDYIATHSTTSVRMVNIGNDNVADFPYVDDETGKIKYHHTDAADIFYAPERLLERIFNNIVANAKAHGFTPEKNNNEIRFDWKSEDGNIVITIANNGLPLKSGVSGSDVLMSGFSTALNEDAADGTLHSGQGGFEIKSLMEGLGSVEVISLPDAEFPVIYKLVFEKTNFETF